MNDGALASQASARLLPFISGDRLTRTPLFVVMGYVVLTFVLFLTWPINWPIYRGWDWAILTLYVLLCFFALSSAAMAGSAGRAHLAAPLPGIRALLFAGAAASALLLAPSCLAYTGRGPWDVLDALRNQGEAYRLLQFQLYFGESRERALVVASRFLAGPLMYAVLPLGVIHWRRIGWTGRAALAVSVVCSIVFSIMRGTDKEIADLFLIGFAALMVSLGRALTLSGRSVRVARRFWLPALIGLALLIPAQGLFTERKEARLPGFDNKAVVCANNSRICADLDSPLIAWLPFQERFGLSEFILATSSGWFGLHLALQKPFESSLGVGHSPAALSVYEALTGDDQPHKRTYTYRNGADEWPEDNYWSTLIAWIANDVGFTGAVAMLALIGFAWGVWWREAAAGMSDPAAVLFVLATTTVFYLPANNQVFAAYEGYSIFFAWLGVWWWHRSRQRIYAALPLATIGAAA
ncbi:MAG TPA: hypothetical protein VIC34_03825 [Croceibacterium sp.]|jgi:hypothetical protein